MAQLADVMAYLCDRYPHKSELSKARVAKMIYLADWRMALQEGRQLTKLDWEFNHYGPYLEDVRNEALKDPRFDVRSETNMYGSFKEVIALKDGVRLDLDLSEQEKSALNHVIDQTKDLTWAPFIKLVYDTFPIATQQRYEKLDLVALAGTYRAQLEAIRD